MAHPKNKISKQRKRTRNAANFKVAATTLATCTQCHVAVRPHCVCKNCGNYKGAKRIAVKSDEKKASE